MAYDLEQVKMAMMVLDEPQFMDLSNGHLTTYLSVIKVLRTVFDETTYKKVVIRAQKFRDLYKFFDYDITKKELYVKGSMINITATKAQVEKDPNLKIIRSEVFVHVGNPQSNESMSAFFTNKENRSKWELYLTEQESRAHEVARDIEEEKYADPLLKFLATMNYESLTKEFIYFITDNRFGIYTKMFSLIQHILSKNGEIYLESVYSFLEKSDSISFLKSVKIGAETIERKWTIVKDEEILSRINVIAKQELSYLLSSNNNNMDDWRFIGPYINKDDYWTDDRIKSIPMGMMKNGIKAMIISQDVNFFQGSFSIDPILTIVNVNNIRESLIKFNNVKHIPMGLVSQPNLDTSFVSYLPTKLKVRTGLPKENKVKQPVMDHINSFSILKPFNLAMVVRTVEAESEDISKDKK